MHTTADTYELLTVWQSAVRNQPNPGQTTFTDTRLHVGHGLTEKGAFEVCITISNHVEKNSGRGVPISFSFEDGCVTDPVITVAADLSAATLEEIEIPLYLLIRDCPPETPNDCTFTSEFSRTVTVSATWTATGPLDPICRAASNGLGRLSEYREAVATGTVDGVQLGTSTGDPSYIARHTNTRC